MAKIEIVYTIEQCINWKAYSDEYFDVTCFCGNETGCSFYTKEDPRVYGSPCIYADSHEQYLGTATNNYEVEIVPSNPFNEEFAYVRIGRKKYHCTKVTIDGEVVYPQDK